ASASMNGSPMTTTHTMALARQWAQATRRPRRWNGRRSCWRIAACSPRSVIARSLHTSWHWTRKNMPEGMTATEMRLCLAALHWSQRDLTRILDLAWRTVNDWASGREEIPPHVADWLRRSAASLRAEPLPERWN